MELDAGAESGHEIHSLLEGSRAWQEGLVHVGDKLVAIDGETAEGVHLRDVLQPGKSEYLFTLSREAPKPRRSQMSAERAEMRTSAAGENIRAMYQIEGPGRSTSHRNYDPTPRVSGVRDPRYDA